MRIIIEANEEIMEYLESDSETVTDNNCYGDCSDSCDSSSCFNLC